MKNEGKKSFRDVAMVVIFALAFSIIGVSAGSLSPSSSPGSTFYTLSQIYNPLASTSFDSSSYTADQNGSVVEILKFISENQFWASTSGDVYTRGGVNRVGIGTSLPQEVLTIAGGSILLDNANGLFIKKNDDTYVGAVLNRTVANNVQLVNDSLGGSVQIFNVNDTGNINFWTGAGQILRANINANGHFDIYKTASVSQDLGVGGNIAIGGNVIFENGNGIFLKMLDGSFGGSVLARTVADNVQLVNNSAVGSVQIINANDAGNISFWTGSDQTLRANIDTNGLFNIYGNTSVSINLEVLGGASASYGMFGSLQVAGTASRSYSRFGNNDTTHVGTIDGTDDLLISGGFEVDGSAAFDSYVYMASDLYLAGLGGGPSSDTVCFDAATKNKLIKCSSSSRYKENVKPLIFDKDDLLALRPVSFDWKQNGGRGVGLIAEDVARLAPDLVFYDDDGHVGGVRYHLLSVYLLDIVKEQEQRLDMIDDLLISKNIEFNGMPIFNSDTAGFAIIHTGSSEVEIVFEKEYSQIPVVQVTVGFDDDGEAFRLFSENNIHYAVIGKTTKGFKIKLDKPSPSDVNFNWTALAVKNPKTFDSIFIVPLPPTESTSSPSIETDTPEPTRKPTTEITPELTPTPEVP